MRGDLKLQKRRRNKKYLYVFYEHVAVQTGGFPASGLTSPTVYYTRVTFYVFIPSEQGLGKKFEITG